MENKRVSNKSPSFNPNSFVPFELYKPLEEENMQLLYNFIIHWCQLLYQFSSSEVPNDALQASAAFVVHLDQEPDTILCLVLKQWSCSCSMDSTFCPAAFNFPDSTPVMVPPIRVGEIFSSGLFNS